MLGIPGFWEDEWLATETGAVEVILFSRQVVLVSFWEDQWMAFFLAQLAVCYVCNCFVIDVSWYFENINSHTYIYIFIYTYNDMSDVWLNFLHLPWLQVPWRYSSWWSRVGICKGFPVSGWSPFSPPQTPAVLKVFFLLMTKLLRSHGWKLKRF